MARYFARLVRTVDTCAPFAIAHKVEKAGTALPK